MTQPDVFLACENATRESLKDNLLTMLQKLATHQGGPLICLPNARKLVDKFEGRKGQA